MAHKYRPQQIFNTLRRDSKLYQTAEQKEQQKKQFARASAIAAKLPAQLQKQAEQ
jgi:hypothetical protein